MQRDLWEKGRDSVNRCRFSLKFQLVPLQIQTLGAKPINSVMLRAAVGWNSGSPHHFRRRTKNNKHKHLGRDGVRHKLDLSLGQTGLVPGTNGDRPLDNMSSFCLIAYYVRHFVQFVRGTGGVHPWDTCPARGSDKCCVCFLCFSLRSHSGTLALKTEDFSKKKSVVLVERKNGSTKTGSWTENPGKTRTGAF